MNRESTPPPPSFDRDAQGRARLGGIVLLDLFRARRLATPAYVYDVAGVREAARALVAAFGEAPHLVAYAVKANTAGPIVRAIAAAGCGADVVSGGELAVALGAGIPADRVVMSGVAKSDDEIDAAIGAGDRGIAAIQLESVEEALRVAARARTLGRRARVGLRINPGVLVDTHANIATGHDEAKFGIPLADLGRAFDAIDAEPSALALVGISSHVGSQLMETSGYELAADRVCDVVLSREARGAKIDLVDFGGGFGVDYGGTTPLAPAAFARAALALAERRGLRGRTIVVEPGRSLVAAMGVLVARVVSTKRAHVVDAATERRWIFIDAGMNDLMRPALYQARHRVEPIDAPVAADARGTRVVGPVCESSDDFGEHPMPDEAPSHVVIRDAGAYGYTMASEYNGRALPIEVFLDGDAEPIVKQSRRVDDWVRERLT